MTQSKTVCYATQAKLKSAHPDHFPIIGVGASAGGLEAFEQLFKNFPDHSGMAFVLVSHLSPNYASTLAEILQRTTTMSVKEAQDQTEVVANHVYVIPPNKSLTIFHRVLQLNVPEQPPGQRMLIDTFLRSLAEDQGDAAIGIILSGTGSDGTLGLRAILGAGGITLVQKPETAKFDGMPLSAIQAGYASYTLPVEKMAELLLNQPHFPIHRKKPPEPAISSGINRILIQLRSSTGHDFSLYKKSTLRRRIERRMIVHNIKEIDVYARYLQEHPLEAALLFKELLINVTHFFRDPEAFGLLQGSVLPQLLQNKPKDYKIRVWVAGCATGEEVYSIAMLLSEYIEDYRNDFKVQIYGTDLNEDTIAIARAGIYPPNIVQDVSPERLQRFFSKEPGGSYRIKKNIREMVVFAIQNLIKDPPFTKLDLLSCRNVMIYLEAELQNRLLPTFHYALKPGGVLFLSPSESIGNHTDLFTALDRKWKLYLANPSSTANRTLIVNNLGWSHEPNMKAHEMPLKTPRTTNFAELSKRALLQFYAPPSVLTDLNGNIVYIHGETGKYLRPAPGQASLNLIDMAREGLALELRAALQNTTAQRIPTFSRMLAVKSNGDFQSVSFNVRLLPKQPDVDGDFLLVSFHDMADSEEVSPNHSSPAELQQVGELQNELAYIRENLQKTLEEQSATKEEFKCTHEEMQSTNEELQSTNEELETSKEELQSTNEELITVNSELQAKIVQLSDIQNDMKNLFDNIRTGIIFLDRQLRIRRFTREATQLYRLVDSDVGRSLSDIKSDLHYEEWLMDAQTVLDTLLPCDREVCTHTKTCFQIRIQPYRTLDNLIDGVVITFTEIGSTKTQAEDK
jgi:two-component system CheB/CheR fusion protein